MRTRKVSLTIAALLTGAALSSCGPEAPLLTEIGEAVSGSEETQEEAQAFSGPAEIRDSWQGDCPVAKLDLLPEGQRDRAAGFIGEAATFAVVWGALALEEEAPEIDFDANLVLFARNTQFYNKTRIGAVNVTDGVAEVLAMETMSAAPIEDKAAMALAVVPRKGIRGVKAGDNVTQIPQP